MTQGADGRPGLGVTAFFAAWCVLGWASVLGNPRLSPFAGAGMDPGPGLLPVLALGTLTAGTALLAVRALMGEPPGWHLPVLPRLRPLLFLASAVAFPWAMALLGHVAATALFVSGWVLATKERPGQHAVTVALVSGGAVAALVHVGFARLIGIPLP